MRFPLIAGNWKMFKDNNEAMELVRDLAPRIADLEGVEVAICPPFTALADASRLIAELGTGIRLGAQNVYPELEGAFTGEISPRMLKALSVDYVIAGHSERRQVLGEDDLFIAAKVRCVFDSGMIPILCVGETLEEREAGKASAKVEGQLESGISLLDPAEIPALVIAYEPIWAIGTGVTATPDDAQEMNSFIRRWVAGACGADASESVRILYGGSVKPENAADLMVMDDIDGALVGGASLKAGDFSAIASFGL